MIKGLTLPEVPDPAAVLRSLLGIVAVTVIAVNWGPGGSATAVAGAAAIAGACMGSCQSIGRAMVGLFAPRANLAEFFGLWTFSTRLASIVGPLAYGVITWVTGGNQRVAIAATALLFVLGLLALMPINVQRGRAAALQPV